MSEQKSRNADAFRKDNAIHISLRIKKDTMYKIDTICEQSNRRRNNAINLILEKALESDPIIAAVKKF